MCSSHVLSSWVALISPGAGWETGWREEVCACLPALWPLAMPAELGRHSLTFLWHTLGIEGLAVGPVLALRQHPRKAGLMGMWSLMFSCLSTSSTKTVFLKALSSLAIQQGGADSSIWHLHEAVLGVTSPRWGTDIMHTDPTTTSRFPHSALSLMATKKHNFRITLYPVYREPSLPCAAANSVPSRPSRSFWIWIGQEVGGGLLFSRNLGQRPAFPPALSPEILNTVWALSAELSLKHAILTSVTVDCKATS